MKISKRGSRIIGKSAVMGMGAASLTHQEIIHPASAKTFQISGVKNEEC
ncbi:hypothetical protein C900_04014 [Fulvivirga imtechensis AK7]|uniref:Uncharacterized protein n=1 Tax=Fulvivirga imtechensis AK7 TaxID=1237149 RepID=L8JS73_9BACT|nr:hypothetical protein C900_04014 [Fulvivirga imtechensis AK7]